VCVCVWVCVCVCACCASVRVCVFKCAVVRGWDLKVLALSWQRRREE
jgi:hypothetical protein